MLLTLTVICRKGADIVQMTNSVLGLPSIFQAASLISFPSCALASTTRLVQDDHSP